MQGTVATVITQTTGMLGNLHTTRLQIYQSTYLPNIIERLIKLDEVIAETKGYTVYWDTVYSRNAEWLLCRASSWSIAVASVVVDAAPRPADDTYGER